MDQSVFTEANREANNAPVASKPYGVTGTLIALNVLVFLAMLASGISLMDPTPRQLLAWGADYGPLTAGAAQWWRLLTACFVHIGVIHIALNMYVLYQAGPFIEAVFGRIRYVIIYLFAGVSGSLVSLWMHPLTVGAGASGAIFGLYGAVFGYLLVERRSLDPGDTRRVAKSAGIFVIYNIMYSLVSVRIDLSAHLGGLVAGFLAGIALVRSGARTSS